MNILNRIKKKITVSKEVDTFVSDVSNLLKPETGGLIMFKNKISQVRKLNDDSNIKKFNKDKQYEYIVRWTVPNKKNNLQSICYVPIDKKTYDSGLKEHKKESERIKKEIENEMKTSESKGGRNRLSSKRRTRKKNIRSKKLKLKHRRLRSRRQ